MNGEHVGDQVLVACARVPATNFNPNHPEGEEWWYLFALKSTMVF